MLVGRKVELDVLVRSLDEIRTSGARTLLIHGEAGIGKSSLLTFLRDTARDRGHATASAVSIDGVWSPPHAPWSSILDQLGLPPLQTSVAIDPDTPPDEHRFRVRHAILDAIREAVSRNPVVITLDDIQWMDQPSRDVLVDLIAGLDKQPMLVAAAWRTPVPEHDREFATFVATMRRNPAVHWLDVTGIDEPDVAAIVERLGRTASPAAIRQLTTRTNGNPFFVSEIVRLAGGSDSPNGEPEPDWRDQGIPPSIRDVVRQRFASLSERTRQVLAVAAIFTDGLDFPILREMSGLPDEDLLDAIDDALDTGFLRPTDRRPEHYTFTHQIVRETIAASWSPSRRARLHRRAAETLEQVFAGQTEVVAEELTLHYFASRSIDGASRGVPFAIASGERASEAFDFEQAAEFLTIARELATGEPAAARTDIEWRRALALAESLRIDDASESAEHAIALLDEANAAPDVVAHVCWRIAHTLNAVGAPVAIRNRAQQAGLRALGDRRDIHWARLRLLTDPIEPVPNDVLFVARWVGYDADAQRIARRSDREEDVVQTIESFEPRTPHETRTLIAHARTWRNPRATLRGLTAAGNDLTYRHGEFRQALSLWNEVLTVAQRIGTIPWQGNALNQITLLHVALGEFDQAVTSKRSADEVNALLGPATDAEALLMERDFVLTHYLDGDWPGQASYWLEFVGDPPLGLEAQLAVPLYAAMAASAASNAGTGVPRALRLLDTLAEIATQPGIQQVNGVVAWAGDAIARLGAVDRARTFDRLAAAALDAGIGDYPQTSLYLTRARMLTLLGDSLAQRMFEYAREALAVQGQVPLLGIACYEQAIAPSTSLPARKRLLQEAIDIFRALGMTTWHERAMAATSASVEDHPDLAGISRRELEVVRLVAQGYSDKRIADELFISERTVNAHLRNLRQKTNTANRTELSSWARDKGILDS